MPRKLAYKMEFLGLPISIENRKGSNRYWYDPEMDEHRETKMEFPYGYVRGTLGLDGDEVDVFVGPNKESRKVFVITQLKRPEFKKIDEQKVMLGFTSSSQAKKAYMRHFDKPDFFDSITEMDIDEFQQKLKSRKGKLIKHFIYGDII